MSIQLELFDLSELCCNTPVQPDGSILNIIVHNFTYDSVSGDIFNINKKYFPARMNISDAGYYRISVGGNSYFAHHIAWYLHYKEWPSRQIDHINRDKTDNSIHNLRYANAYVQNNNREFVHIDDRKYIYFYQRKYQVIIPENNTLGRSRVYLGRFKNLKDAISARNDYLGVMPCEV